MDGGLIRLRSAMITGSVCTKVEAQSSRVPPAKTFNVADGCASRSAGTKAEATIASVLPVQAWDVSDGSATPMLSRESSFGGDGAGTAGIGEVV